MSADSNVTDISIKPVDLWGSDFSVSKLFQLVAVLVIIGLVSTAVKELPAWGKAVMPAAAVEHKIKLLQRGKIEFPDGRVFEGPCEVAVAAGERVTVRLVDADDGPIFDLAPTYDSWKSVDKLLIVDSPRFSGRSLAALKGSTITVLEIGHTGVSNEVVASLHTIMPQLVDLGLTNNAQLGDDAFRNLSEFMILRALSIAGTSASDSTIEALTKRPVPTLVFLDASFTYLSNSGLGQLKALGKLEVLRIINCKRLTPEAIKAIKATPHLRVEDELPKSVASNSGT